MPLAVVVLFHRFKHLVSESQFDVAVHQLQLEPGELKGGQHKRMGISHLRERLVQRKARRGEHEDSPLGSAAAGDPGPRWT